MKRRSFILLSGLAISATGVSVVNLFDLSFAGRSEHTKPKFLSQLCDNDTVRDLGRIFLELNPLEKRREVLETKLYGASVNIASLAPEEIVRLQRGLEKSIYKDFDAGETIILKGWILSLTEARQCALYFILNS